MKLTPEEEAGYSDSNNNKQQKHLSAEQIEYEERRKQRARDEMLRKHQVVARRESVFSLTSRGHTQVEVSKLLGISQAQVSLDLQYLRSQFKNTLRNHIEFELPLLFNQSMRGLSEVIRQAYIIHDTPGVSEQIKLHALQLIADVHEQRFDLSCSGEILQSGITYVSNMKAHLNRMVQDVPQDQVREMLHEEIQQQEDQEEGQSHQTPAPGDDDVVSEKEKSSAAFIDEAQSQKQNDEVFSKADPVPSQQPHQQQDKQEEEDSGNTTTNTVF